MISITTLSGQLASLLRQKVSDVTIKIGQANQENPAFPNWISYDLVNWRQVGSHEEFYVDDEEDNSDHKTESLWLVDLQIVCGGLKAEQTALQLAHQFNKQSYLEGYQDLGLYYLNKSNIKFAPRQLSTGWEARHLFDVTFNIIVSDTDQVDFVDIVEITTEVLDVDDSVLLEETVEIDI